MSRPPDLDPLTEYEQRKATRNTLVETALRGDPVALKRWREYRESWRVEVAQMNSKDFRAIDRQAG
jgi:hypothetical protein